MAEMYADIERLSEISYTLMQMGAVDEGRMTPLREQVQQMLKLVERNPSLVKYGYREQLEAIATVLETCETHLFGLGYLLFQLEAEYRKTEQRALGAKDRYSTGRRGDMEPWEVDEMVDGMLEEQERAERERAEAERQKPHYDSVEDYYNSKWFHVDKSSSHFTGFCVSPENEVNGGGGTPGKLSGSCVDMQGVLVVFPENDYFNIRINYGYQVAGGGLGLNMEGDSTPPKYDPTAPDNDWGGFDASVTGVGVRGGLGMQFGKTKVDLTGSVSAGAGATFDGSTQYNDKTNEETTSLNAAGGVLGKFGGTASITSPRPSRTGWAR